MRPLHLCQVLIGPLSRLLTPDHHELTQRRCLGMLISRWLQRQDLLDVGVVVGLLLIRDVSVCSWSECDTWAAADMTMLKTSISLHEMRLLRTEMFLTSELLWWRSREGERCLVDINTIVIRRPGLFCRFRIERVVALNGIMRRLVPLGIVVVVVTWKLPWWANFSTGGELLWRLHKSLIWFNRSLASAFATESTFSGYCRHRPTSLRVSDNSWSQSDTWTKHVLPLLVIVAFASRLLWTNETLCRALLRVSRRFLDYVFVNGRVLADYVLVECFVLS